MEDSDVFSLGAPPTRIEALIRLPSAEKYALAVPKEHRWLPLLAPHLPVTIPTPLGMGGAGRHCYHTGIISPWR